MDAMQSISDDYPLSVEEINVEGAGGSQTIIKLNGNAIFAEPVGSARVEKVLTKIAIAVRFGRFEENFYVNRPEHRMRLYRPLKSSSEQP